MVHSSVTGASSAAALLMVAVMAGVTHATWATEQKNAGPTTNATKETSMEESTKASATQAAKVTISEEFLNDEENVAAGKALWQKQCRHCHGKSAYPGKAPKLKPRKYTAEFVYDRVTNGFRKMPPWKAVFSDEERMAITAFVKSRKFSP